MKKVFVLMPFREEFDDVYLVVKDCCQRAGGNVECQRCDEIEHTGYITEAFLQAIKAADVLVADLTGSNPNVMYEVGFADALEKPVILISQGEAEKAPFDVRSKRLITYDRQRLMRDLGPKLLNAVRVALGRSVVGAGSKVAEPTVEPAPQPPPRPQVQLPPLFPSSRLTLQIASFELKLEMARKKSDHATMGLLYGELAGVVDRIQPGGRADSDDLRNVVGGIGNCAVEFELAEMFDQAETLWKKAIALCPTYAGVHYQYADFLIDRSRVDESVEELKRAVELNPGDQRRERLEAKVAIARGHKDPTVQDRLRRAWEADKGNRVAAAAYLTYLDSIQGSIEEFERVCNEWSAHAEPGFEHEGRRALADYLAGRGESVRSRKMYEELLPTQQGEHRLGVLHNLATVCLRLGDRDAALKYWREAYAIDRDDPTVRASFSQLLGRMGRQAEALKVLSGEPLD